jgi:hypothetical protein
MTVVLPPKRLTRAYVANVTTKTGVLRFYTSLIGGEVWLWIEAHHKPLAPYPAGTIGKHSHTVYGGPADELFLPDHTLVKQAAQRMLMRGIEG